MKPTMDLSGTKAAEWTGSRLCGGILEPTGVVCGSASSGPMSVWAPGADLQMVTHGWIDPKGRIVARMQWRRLLLAFILGAIAGVACVAAFGCSSAYYTDGESVAYGTDVYTQRRFAGSVRTPKGLTFEGEASRRVDAEGITATGQAVRDVIDSALGKAVAGGQIKADLALKLRELAMEEVRLRATPKEPKPAEKAGSR